MCWTVLNVVTLNMFYYEKSTIIYSIKNIDNYVRENEMVLIVLWKIANLKVDIPQKSIKRKVV